MKQHTKLISVFMVCVLLGSLFFATLFISSHLHHDCTGKDCPVCEQLHISEELVHRVLTAILCVVAAFFLCAHAQTGMAKHSCAILYQNPIRLKVKMQN